MSDFCFIIIHCHGELRSTVVPIPSDKTIIKKNLAPCGFVALADTRPNSLYKISSSSIEDSEEKTMDDEDIILLNYYYNLEKTKRKLIELDDINQCITYDEYKDICIQSSIETCSEKLYKNSCMVLTDKSKYLMREYSSENPNTDKLIIMIQNPDIMDRPDGTRKYEDYIHFDLFDPKDMWNLLNIYSTWKTNLDLVNKVHYIMLNAYSNHPDWIESDIVDDVNPYYYKVRSNYLNTIILFDIIEILPQHIIKILDMTCAQIPVKESVEVYTKLYQHPNPKKRNVDNFGWGGKRRRGIKKANKLKHKTRKHKHPKNIKNISHKKIYKRNRHTKKL